MSLGKPVIATNWSGNTDYMTADNSFGIDYRLVKLEKDYGPYEAGQYWAEPDIDQAAHRMRQVSEDSELAERVGRAGQQTIRATFSPQAVREIISKRLSYLRGKYS